MIVRITNSLRPLCIETRCILSTRTSTTIALRLFTYPCNNSSCVEFLLQSHIYFCITKRNSSFDGRQSFYISLCICRNLCVSLNSRAATLSVIRFVSDIVHTMQIRFVLRSVFAHGHRLRDRAVLIQRF